MVKRNRGRVDTIEGLQNAVNNNFSSYGANLDEFDRVKKSQRTDLVQQAPSLEVISSGIEVVGGVFMTATGINPESLPSDYSIDDWKQLGRMLLRVQGAVQWAIGDWLIIGETKFEHGQIQSFALEMDLSPGTFYNFKFVAGRIKYSLRRPELSFGHHKAVAPQHVEEPVDDLQYAIDKSLSVSAFRRYIKNKYNEDKKRGRSLNKYDVIFETMESNRERFIERFEQAPDQDKPRLKELVLKYVREWVEWVNEI